MAAGRMYEFGEFRLDPAGHLLFRHGAMLPLTPKAVETLRVLVENRGNVVEKDDLLKKVWPDTFVDENSLTRNISVLRKVLGYSPEGHEYIVTIPKRGYRFVKTVREVQESSPGPAVGAPATGALAPEAEVVAAEAAKPRARYGLLAFIGLAALSVAILGLNIDGVRERLFGKPVAPRIQSIAVLPLENLSKDPEQEYFADGMTDELIAELAKISALRVISRTSVMQYKGTKKPMPQIAKELNVDGVVEGSVQRSGDKVRITAQLIEGPTDRHLWVESYERDLRDILALQSDVAKAIAATGEVALGQLQAGQPGGLRALSERPLLLGKEDHSRSKEGPRVLGAGD